MRGAKKLGFGRELGFADKKIKYFVFFDDWVTLNRSCALKYIYRVWRSYPAMNPLNIPSYL
jgi:hypothetical protein